MIEDTRCPLCRDILEKHEYAYTCITCDFIGFENLQALTKYNENKKNTIR